MNSKPSNDRKRAIWNKNTTCRVIDTTWPTARIETRGAFQFKSSDGGGRRVNSVMLVDNRVPLSNVPDAAIFQIWTEDSELDSILCERGYREEDESLVLILQPRSTLPNLDIHVAHKPDAALIAFWRENNVDGARVNVMSRVKTPYYIHACHGDDIVAAGFVGRDQDLAMLHSLVVSPAYRGRGFGDRFLDAIIQRISSDGPTTFMTIVVAENKVARRLFQRFNGNVVAQYKYRIRTK